MSVEQKIHQHMSLKSCLFIKCCVVKSYNTTNVVIKLQTQTTKTSSSPAAGTSGSDPTLSRRRKVHCPPTVWRSQTCMSFVVRSESSYNNNNPIYKAPKAFPQFPPQCESLDLQSYRLLFFKIPIFSSRWWLPIRLRVFALLSYLFFKNQNSASFS